MQAPSLRTILHGRDGVERTSGFGIVVALVPYKVPQPMGFAFRILRAKVGREKHTAKMCRNCDSPKDCILGIC